MSLKTENSGKYKVAIIGSRDEILCFRAFGVEIIPVKDAVEATRKLLKIKKSNQAEDNNAEKYAIIFIMEDMIKEIADDDIKKITTGALPSVIALPGHKGASGFGETKLRGLVEKAVGSDIFGN